MNSNNTCAVDMSHASLFGIPTTFYNIVYVIILLFFNVDGV